MGQYIAQNLGCVTNSCTYQQNYSVQNILGVCCDAELYSEQYIGPTNLQINYHIL